MPVPRTSASMCTSMQTDVAGNARPRLDGPDQVRAPTSCFYPLELHYEYEYEYNVCLVLVLLDPALCIMNTHD